MPLERPPRPPAGEVTDAVRGAILRRAHEDLGLNSPKVLSLHTEADHLGDTKDLLDDVDRRYQLEPGTTGRKAADIVVAAQTGPRSTYGGAGSTPNLASEEWARAILLALPATDFLTAIEHAIELGHVKRLYGGHEQFSGTDEATPLAREFMDYADAALRSHGTPYRGVTRDWRFEWIGDPQQHELTLRPALLALADQRLMGARAEFEEALQKRRDGTPKDLEDAVDEAAKSVESILKVLHDEHGVARSGSEPVLALFVSLKSAGVLPGYITNLVTAAAGPRNHMASHGQGGTVREVREELAEASIAAAATAITFLAHYLP